MKKFLGILCCVFFCGTAWAQIDKQAVGQKIRQVQLIEEEAFQWPELEYLTPDWIELKALAKKVYEQNPASFNAAYNYGVITYDVWEYELGPIMNEDILNEAFEAFEHARALIPNKVMLFEREYDIFYLSLLGNNVPTPLYRSENILEIYQSHPKKAEEMLFVIQRVFSLKGFDLNQVAPNYHYRDMAFQAFMILLSQNNYTEAKRWLPALGGEKKLIEIWRGEGFGERDLSDQSFKNYSDALKQVEISTSTWQQEEEEVSQIIQKVTPNKILNLKEKYKNLIKSM